MKMDGVGRKKVGMGWFIRSIEDDEGVEGDCWVRNGVHQGDEERGGKRRKEQKEEEKMSDDVVAQLKRAAILLLK